MIFHVINFFFFFQNATQNCPVNLTWENTWIHWEIKIHINAQNHMVTVHGHLAVAHVVILTSPTSVSKPCPRLKEASMVADGTANEGAFPFHRGSGVI